MKQGIAMKWIAALRSGRYKQGKARLKTYEGKYCCLGVLCKVAKVKFLPDATELPDEAVKKTGMQSLNGYVYYDGPEGYISLTDANDSDVTFTKIADWIESNYSRL